MLHNFVLYIKYTQLMSAEILPFDTVSICEHMFSLNWNINIYEYFICWGTGVGGGK